MDADAGAAPRIVALISLNPELVARRNRGCRRSWHPSGRSLPGQDRNQGQCHRRCSHATSHHGYRQSRRTGSSNTPTNLWHYRPTSQGSESADMLWQVPAAFVWTCPPPWHKQDAGPERQIRSPAPTQHLTHRPQSQRPRLGRKPSQLDAPIQARRPGIYGDCALAASESRVAAVWR